MDIKKGPWTIKESATVYKNPWITVTEDQVITPDGKDGIFGMITMKPGVSILPMDNEGNVYLTKEFHYAVGKETVAIPSGGIDGNESILDSAKRELEEETGIVALEWIDMGMIDPFTAVVLSPNYMFLAKGLSFNTSNQEGTEKIELLKLSFERALEMAMNGEITHGASVALIFKTKIYLDQ